MLYMKPFVCASVQKQLCVRNGMQQTETEDNFLGISIADFLVSLGNQYLSIQFYWIFSALISLAALIVCVNEKLMPTNVNTRRLLSWLERSQVHCSHGDAEYHSTKHQIKRSALLVAERWPKLGCGFFDVGVMIKMNTFPRRLS